MAIITISRDSYCPSKEVAEKVAEKLGLSCVSGDVLAEASQEFGVPQIELLHALRDAPSLLERLGFGKEAYVAYIRVALLTHLQKDNVVYHGLAGHYFVEGVDHALKVRIIGEPEDRVEILMHRQQLYKQAAAAFSGMSVPGARYARGQPIRTKEHALRVLEESDKARRRWGLHIYGIDTHDPSCYDLVLRVRKLTIDDVAEVICHTVRRDRFRATRESQQAIDDLLLAARVQAHLVRVHPRVEVSAEAGNVCIRLEGASSQEQQTIRNLLEPIPGIKQIHIGPAPSRLPN